MALRRAASETQDAPFRSGLRRLGLTTTEIDRVYVMPLVFAGSLALHIRRGKIAGAGSQLHIELFGDATHTYCGVPTQGMKLSYLIFQGELRAPQDTCVQCAALFERLLNEELDAIPVDTPEETQNG